MSKKKTKPGQDALFEAMPPNEAFDAFPSLESFPEGDIAFLTGKAPAPASAFKSPRAPGTAASGDSSGVNAADAPLNTLKQAKHSAKLAINQTNSQTSDQSIRQTTEQNIKQPTAQPASQPAAQRSPAKTTAALKTTRAPKPPAAADSKAEKPSGSGRPGPATPDPRAGAVPGAALEATAQTQTGRPDAWERLNPNQRAVLARLAVARPYIITFKDLGEPLGLCEATTRTVLRRLRELGFLTFAKARDGAIQGVRVRLDGEACDRTVMEKAISLSLGQPDSQPVKQPETPGSEPSGARPDSPAPGRARQRPKEPALQEVGQRTPIPDASEVKEPTPFPEWDDAYLKLMWPAVSAAGFTADSLKKAALARMRRGLAPDRRHFALSLDRADWELETHGFLADPANDRAAHPAELLFTALARFGVFRAHPGYVSRQEAQAAEAESELRRRTEIAANVESAAFAAWKATLSTARRHAIAAKRPTEDPERVLFEYWHDHGK